MKEKCFFQICFGLHFLCLHFHFVPADAVSKSNIEIRWKRAINERAPEGKCLVFQVEKGSDGKTVEYVCCNSCYESDRSCDTTTYESSSSAQYCERCGKSALSYAQMVSQPFPCGGCYRQTQRKNTCQGLYSNIRVGCWLFRACFENECKKEKGHYVDTCFNGFCDPHENVDICPADCCPKQNPQNCSFDNGQCPAQCCEQSTCCFKEDDDSELSLGMKILKWFGITVLILVLIGLMYCTGVYCECSNAIGAL